MDSELTGTQKISPQKLMGTDSPSLGRVGGGPYGGTSATGKLAGIVRKNRIKINENDKNIKINVDKLTGLSDSVEQIHEQLLENLLKTVQEEPKEEEKKEDKSIEALSNNLNVIATELVSINAVLANDLKLREKRAQAVANKALQDKRAKKEKQLENKTKKKPRKTQTSYQETSFL